MGQPHHALQPLRFRDTDAMGHVNNAVYAELLEVGRVGMLQQAGLMDRPGIGAVIVRLELDFVREMTWPGDVAIETAVLRLGGKSVHVRQELTQRGTLRARAASVLAVIDVATRRAVPLQAAWRDALSAFLVAPG